ncbi:NAD-dependent succinate-semialdehyde dehydrogenase [Bartonella sp. HY329]|uniref:NAD-dependent succinate-semialdehyde dehydrogenase n=1 Tax=unclassified Bartonella TaxID=2645622 RepID=UPI0021C6CA78|nr:MULTISPECIES: NAD-dependent succinate-semialdehyde dehydrogenase [unclassified Bartonella]UXM94419.1 NAD-dependent succinate-semialdehyde dehydrogenase [Bartonella sp. HY329]UXN08743.1 NAD-dependent succinate-semialdehyde dehydrogenase [Bartonella sp. HY328]
MYARFGLFIDGQWQMASSGAQLEVINPANQQHLGYITLANASDTKRAITAAVDAFSAWSNLSSWVRADYLHKIADIMRLRTDEAAHQMTLESGKPLAQAKREWELSVDQFRWAAEEARRIYGRLVESRVDGGRFEISHEPVGVVGIFTAWNFPAVLLARKIAPALAAGCSLIARPSNSVPGVAMILFDCLKEANLPKGVVNLVIGNTPNTYQPIMDDYRVRKISLTGSTRIGQQMIVDSAKTLKRTSMELGGNAPLIVFGDCDIEKTLDLAVATKFANAGQVCVTPNRIYVERAIFKAFVQGFVARVKKIKLGNGLDSETTMGPLINAQRREEMAAIVQDAIAKGGSIEAGGKRPEQFDKGYFFEPTVLTGMGANAIAVKEESFGPIAPILPFDDEDEVLAAANASQMGLSAYVFTNNAARMRKFIAGLEAGMVGVNSFALAAAEAPFGGIKSSGMGREGGIEAILEYCNVKLAQICV